MSYYLTKYEVQTINQNHKHYADIYVRGNPYTIGAIIYTHLTEVKNSTLFLEIYINNDWKTNSQETAILFINEWLNRYEELNQCKFYKASIYKTKSLGFSLHQNDNFDEAIKQITVQNKPLKSENSLQGIFTNKEPKNLFQRLKNTFKPYPFTTTIYKLQIELDLQFYSIYLDSFIRFMCYNDDEKDFYNNEITGIPTILKVELSNNNGYIEFPNLDKSKLSNHSQYAVMTFKQTDFSYSTKAVLNIRGVELYSIEVYKFNHNKKSKQIAKEDKTKLQLIGFI